MFFIWGKKVQIQKIKKEKKSLLTSNYSEIPTVKILVTITLDICYCVYTHKDKNLYIFTLVGSFFICSSIICSFTLIHQAHLFKHP